MQKKQVFVPDNAGDDMVTALRYLMGNPWVAVRIENSLWNDQESMHLYETMDYLHPINGWTAALCEPVPMWSPHNKDFHPYGVDEALRAAPATTTFDYVVPERAWVPERLEIVQPYCEVENPWDEEDDWVWKNREDMTPQENRAKKLADRIGRGGDAFLTKGTTATVMDPEQSDWKMTALRSWEAAVNWETQYRKHHHHARSTAKQLQVFEDLVAAYARRFLLGLDQELDALVMCTRNSPDWQAANIELLRGDINNPPNTTAGKGPGVVVPG